MYNRYIPNGNTYTRVVEQDAPDRMPSGAQPQQQSSPQSQQPVHRQVQGGQPGQKIGGGAPGDSRPAGAGSSSASPGQWQFPGGLGGLFSNEKGGLGSFFSGERGGLGSFLSSEKGGIGGLLKMLHLEELDSGDVLLMLIVLFLLVEGDNLDLVITLGLMLLLGLSDEKREKEGKQEEKEQGG